MKKDEHMKKDMHMKKEKAYEKGRDGNGKKGAKDKPRERDNRAKDKPMEELWNISMAPEKPELEELEELCLYGSGKA